MPKEVKLTALIFALLAIIAAIAVLISCGKGESSESRELRAKLNSAQEHINSVTNELQVQKAQKESAEKDMMLAIVITFASIIALVSLVFLLLGERRKRHGLESFIRKVLRRQ